MLSIQEKAAQVVFPRLGSNMIPPIKAADDFNRFNDLLRAFSFGGLVLFNGDVDTTPLALAELQSNSSFPLLVGSDIERGAGQQLSGATLFPHARAIGQAGLEATKKFARITATEALACGLHIAFAPVADVNLNPRNPIIGIRAFGNSASHVAQHTTCFIENCQDLGLYATAKHFPGHGNTAQDSHAELPVVTSSKQDLEAHELLPFQSSIKAKVGGIMTAHVAFPALDPHASPATISKPILTDLLRNKLGYTGVILTDSLIMKGIWSQGLTIEDTAALLLNAGVDILLDPPEPAALVEAIVKGIESGSIRESRIDQAIVRIATMKKRLTERFSPQFFTSPFSTSPKSIVGCSDHKAAAHKMALQAINTTTSVNHSNGLLSQTSAIALHVRPYKTPVDPPEQPLATLFREHFPDIAYFEINDTSSEKQLRNISEAALQVEQILLFVVAKPAAWRSFGLPNHIENYLAQLIQQNNIFLIALGDPGISDLLPKSNQFACTYSDTIPSQFAIINWLKDA